MNRFRRLGFIDYAGGSEGALQVHSSFCTTSLSELPWLELTFLSTKLAGSLA
jgi:hypothetical protein